ncbi:MAG: hypothetical protein V4524_00520 [Patescibacteria group bacterium]
MKIDDVLFDYIFQPFAHWFQRMTGKDNFYLGLHVILIAALSICCLGALTGSTRSYFTSVVIGFLGVTATRALKRQYERENNGKESLALNFMRSILVFKFIRLFYLIISLNMLLLLLLLLFLDAPVKTIRSVPLTSMHVWSFTAYLYFIACTPLPPRKGKIGEMLRSIGNKLKEALPKPGGLVPAPSPT